MRTELECTTAGAFAKIVAEVERDVLAYNDLSGDGERVLAGEASEDDGGKMFVVKEVFPDGRPIRPASVSFAYTSRDVRIWDDMQDMRIIVRPQMNADGECVYVVDDVVVAAWEISKQALHRLLFSPQCALN